MELSAEEIRVLGCLIEKESATPDQYPLTTNALVNACNQKTSRDPVVSYDDRTVDAAMLSLRQLGLARTVRGSGRSDKHKHVVLDALSLDQAQLAVLAVLMLRGPQTVGELRNRTERIHAFESLEQVEQALASLSSLNDPLVERLNRQPGQKEERWRQLLGEEVEPPAAPASTAHGRETVEALDPRPMRNAPPLPAQPPASAELARLSDAVAVLSRQVAFLADALGVDLDEIDT
ncbi:MAG: YceH family protein [Acidimicrobiales bacterium]|nr:YceH family protein [Acidimicrobiales bacterium]